MQLSPCRRDSRPRRALRRWRCLLVALLLLLGLPLFLVLEENWADAWRHLNDYTSSKGGSVTSRCACELCHAGALDDTTSSHGHARLRQPHLDAHSDGGTFSLNARADGHGGAALHLAFGAAVAYRMGAAYHAVGERDYLIHGVHRAPLFTMLFGDWDAMVTPRQAPDARVVEGHLNPLFRDKAFTATPADVVSWMDGLYPGYGVDGMVKMVQGAGGVNEAVQTVPR